MDPKLSQLLSARECLHFCIHFKEYLCWNIEFCIDSVFLSTTWKCCSAVLRVSFLSQINFYCYSSVGNVSFLLGCCEDLLFVLVLQHSDWGIWKWDSLAVTGRGVAPIVWSASPRASVLRVVVASRVCALVRSQAPAVGVPPLETVRSLLTLHTTAPRIPGHRGRFSLFSSHMPEETASVALPSTSLSFFRPVRVTGWAWKVNWQRLTGEEHTDLIEFLHVHGNLHDRMKMQRSVQSRQLL